MFQMELKRKRSVSPRSSNLRNPKRRATPKEDSPLARLFNNFRRPTKIKFAMVPKRKTLVKAPPVEDFPLARLFNNFPRPTKTKFAMEFKRKRSVSPHSSNLRNPKRRATPVEDSPLARLFNDVGIKALAREVGNTIIQNGKTFFFFIKVIMSDGSPEECAKDIYDLARQVWMYNLRLLSACTYAIHQVPCFSDTLVAHANKDAPEQRMASMMKDPWLDYVLRDQRRQSDSFITRGFLSILIAYWNMKDILDKYSVSSYGHRCVIPKGGKYELIYYAVDHFQDFQNLKEVLDSKYGSDPGLVGSLFKQIRDFQLNGMNLARKWKSGRRSMIQVVLLSAKPYLATPGATVHGSDFLLN